MAGSISRIDAVIDGYDLVAELGRYAFPDVVVEGVRLNRGTARVAVSRDPEDGFAEDARKRHREHLFSTTHDAHGPVLELGYPVAGHFVAARNGVHLDMYLGVAQKLLDENHPNLLAAVERLRDLRLLLRREILTDDFFAARAGIAGVVTTAELAETFAGLAARSFPRSGGYRVFFSNSGTEANEAAIKLAQRVRYSKLVRRYGHGLLRELMGQLRIGELPFFAGQGAGEEPVYADYPFFLVACDGAFHGRTLGALNLTHSKKNHQLGFSKLRWVRHVPFDGAPDVLEKLLDPRPLDQVVRGSGGVAAVLDRGLLPAELTALFAIEGFQGEGGYRIADAAFLRGVRETCRRHDILYLADEVQSFGRTGALFVHERLGVAPDIITLAKGAWVGATIAPAELEEHLVPGWHSNTWGGGKVFDNAVAYATLKTLTEHRDPVFLGLTYLENERVKGEYVRQCLAGLAEQFPDTLLDFSGLGGLFGVTVERRDALVALAWRRGLKLLGAGTTTAGRGRLRLVFLADCLTREVDAFIDAFGRVLAEFGGAPGGVDRSSTVE